MGIVVLSGVFILAKSWGLFLTTWVFQILWQVFVILLIILFQKEIRQMLERFNPLKNMGMRHDKISNGWVPEFSRWAFDAAQKRIGAVVIFEKTDPVSDLVTRGIPMECEPLPEILNSIFYKQSPLHDGAILIFNGKISKVSCYLPLSTREDLPQEWGTRHRAALGLSEQCNAWVLIISEERGEVSFAFDNQVKKIKDEKELSFFLETQVFNEKEPEMNIRQVILSWFTKRYKIKAVVFVLVFVLWLVFAGQQNFEKKIELPLVYRNIPESIMVSSPAAINISVTCRGLRKDISLLSKENMMSSLDLASAKRGKLHYNITKANLTLPNERIDIVNISPGRVEIITEKAQKPDIKNKSL
ncbi:MAG: hypothetical protein A2097_02540 [Desulfobacula sp. GWF2_41_7]|nr:MAG: hypothetical protein A2097_02540 [Desulfobacula sp. GWF2_41_7]